MLSTASMITADADRAAAVLLGTTVWERWDSMLPDGSINPGDMTSFNHYALGAVADWLYQVVAGIQPASPGYDPSDAPRPPVPASTGPRAPWRRHGRVECGWQRTVDGYTVDVLVPENAPAELVLPDGSVHALPAGRHTFTSL